MRLVKEFIMNFETILFCPNYDEYGNLHTRIFEDLSVFMWMRVQTDLMDSNLNILTVLVLKVLSDGASMILGGISMTPIIVNRKNGVHTGSRVNRRPERIACGLPFIRSSIMSTFPAVKRL